MKDYRTLTIIALVVAIVYGVLSAALLWENHCLKIEVIKYQEIQRYNRLHTPITHNERTP